jgi:hypothetical protein
LNIHIRHFPPLPGAAVVVIVWLLNLQLPV